MSQKWFKTGPLACLCLSSVCFYLKNTVSSTVSNVTTRGQQSSVTTPNVYYRKTKISNPNPNLIIVPITPTKSHVYTPDQLHETMTNTFLMKNSARGENCDSRTSQIGVLTLFSNLVQFYRWQMSEPVRTSFLVKFYPLLPRGYSHEFESHKCVPLLTQMNKVEERNRTFEPQLNSQDIPLLKFANFGQYLKNKSWVFFI